MKRLLATSFAAMTFFGWTQARAFEFGYPGYTQKPGITLGGGSAGTPPPGLYMFDQAYTYQANIVGPGAPNVGGAPTSVKVAGVASGLLWVPGWEVLGAQYNAVIVQPAAMVSIGAPLGTSVSGLQNTYIVPGELSWRLGDSGFFVKAGFGMYVPDGTVGNTWWTYQPEFVVSYLKDGWNLTANLFMEFNARNPATKYQSGDVLHAEFTATKQFGNWTIGPVGYYVGQITDDRSSAFYGNAINTNRYDIWAVGGLVGYNFGPVQLNIWATDEISAKASGGTAFPGADTAVAIKGWSVFGQLSYRLWGPDAPAAAPKKLVYK
ncbi:transporter [Bradyrhizobium sp. CCBAU 53338]|uniref:SphA family protein n=1 Tax=Bradyrhizobium sp. CCBAU 53338 TaxID=1325111 RepID=UPI00188BB70B|nr:transporter [Bradyrhizobium sp. CCBAU 53338]QOZ51480.1 hypothetical protein XH90_08880 [Bradyrhizobium sp. CCBAU 53338]